MKPIKIFLFHPIYQDNESISRNAFPLNLGYIASYANKQFGAKCDITIFQEPEAFLAAFKASPPDILGIGSYLWNLSIGIWAAQKAKKIHPSCLIAVGGPNVDNDPETQVEFFEKFKGSLDFMIPNEGEVGFSNLIEAFEARGLEGIRDQEIGGVAFLRNEELVAAGPAAQPDLAELPSPILSGILDDFMKPQLLPFIQTSRNCPYQCTYCVSGRITGKIRTFDPKVIQQELEYLAGYYKEHPQLTLYICDDNFGINKQDEEVAQLIKDTSLSIGWPKKIFVYIDKRFTQRIRDIYEILSELNARSYPVPFQTLNPDVSSAVKRKNITVDNIASIIDWADETDNRVVTDLILGLPKETKESFLQGFDYCLSHKIEPNLNMLILLPGSEMARLKSKAEYGLEFKYRPAAYRSYMELDGDFVCEHEQLVTSNTSITYSDFVDLRKFALSAYLFMTVGQCSDMLTFLSQNKVSPSKFLLDMMDPLPGSPYEESHKLFVQDFLTMVDGELFNTAEELNRELHQNIKNGVLPARINTFFCARLIYEEKWFFDWLKDYGKTLDLDHEVYTDLVNIGESEWLEFDQLDTSKTVQILGKTAMFLNLLENNQDENGKYEITLSASEGQQEILKSFYDTFGQKSEFHYAVISQLGNYRGNICEKRDLKPVE